MSHGVQNFVLFAHIFQLLALKGGAMGVGKTKDQLMLDINREKKQKFNLINKLTTRCHKVSKSYLFTFLVLLMALKGGTTGV